MSFDLFLRGLVIGFAIAFALGPIGLLVIRRTIDRGWVYGFMSGVGVATADATYGAIAAFGLTAVTELLVGIDRELGLIGGTVLIVIAVRSLRHACSPVRPSRVAIRSRRHCILHLRAPNGARQGARPSFARRAPKRLP